MKSKFLALFVIVLVAVCVSTAWPDFGSFSGNSDYGSRSSSGSSSHSSSRSYTRSYHGSDSNSDSDSDSMSCGDTVLGILGLGVMAGIYYFFAWCWRMFKAFLWLMLWPVRKLLGIQDKDSRPQHQQVIINAPAPTKLRPIKQYYKLDPEFDEEAIRSLIANLYVQMQDTWRDKDISSLRPYMTDEFYSQMDRQLDAFRKQHKTDYTENIAVLNVSLIGWRQAGGMDYITVSINTRITSYTLDDNTGKLLSGDRQREKFMEYEIDLSRKRGIITAPKSERAGSQTCPHCGAPVNLNASAKCEYCGSVLTRVNTDWTICAMRGISQRTA